MGGDHSEAAGTPRFAARGRISAVLGVLKIILESQVRYLYLRKPRLTPRPSLLYASKVFDSTKHLRAAPARGKPAR